MANPKGVFDKNALAAGWFDETANSSGWFDGEQLSDAAAGAEWRVHYADMRVPLGTPPAGTTLNAWNGSAWVPGTLRRWNGSAWEAAALKRWNGSAWITA